MNVWTVVGALVAGIGLISILMRQQEIRDRQTSYDPHRWWSYPPIWQENMITVLGGLLVLAVGIFLIVSSFFLSPISR